MCVNCLRYVEPGFHIDNEFFVSYLFLFVFQLVPQHLPAGDQSKERIVRVTGDKKQIEVARDLIKEVMNQVRDLFSSCTC